MLRKFTFALAVTASIIALIPDSASAWGGFGGFSARFGGSHFGGFGASLGGGSRNRPTAFSRPTMQRPTAFTERPTARTRPTIQRPTAFTRPTQSPTTLATTTLAKLRHTQSPTTPTIATNKNPSSPPAAGGSKGNCWVRHRSCQPQSPPGPTTSTTWPPVVPVIPPSVVPPPVVLLGAPSVVPPPEPSRGGGGPALPPQWRIAPPTQPPTGVAGKPPSRRQGSAPVIPANEDRFVRDEVLVEFRPDVSPQAVFDIAMREQLTLVASQRLELIDSTINRYQILDGRSVPGVVAALARNPNIVSTQPNYLYSLQQEERGSPQEPYPRARMHLDAAHSISEGGGTLVAVIDTIIDSAHPEIAGSIVDSVDLIRADPKPNVKGMPTYENALVTMSGGSASEPDVHGTAIAGVIAAHGELTGVAPKARILAVRAFAPRSDGRGAQGTTHNIVTGIDWAFKHGARVANLSFGGPSDELLSYALAIGVARRMIFVASVGNEGEEAPSLYPAADENVIAATASDEKGGVFKRANHCSLACVAAPGVDLRVSAPPAGYRTASGTSLAAAHIAGVVALVLDKRSDLEPRKVREALFGAAKRSSRSRPYPAETSIAGVVDAYETLEAALVEPKEPTAEVTSENSTHAPYIGVNPD
jgi:subtilisin family serine protease